MACRDCVWWNPNIGKSWGVCEWMTLAILPYWLVNRTNRVTYAPDGEGCPQFKERNDGE